MNKNIMIATLVASVMSVGLQAYEGLPASVTREQSMVVNTRLENEAPPSTVAQQKITQAPPSTTTNTQQVVTQAPPSTTRDLRQTTTDWQNSSTVQSIKQNVPQTGKTGRFGFF